MERNSEEVAVPVGQTGPLNGGRWHLNGPLVIGREPYCNIVNPDRQVSRQHARIIPTPKGILLEDLGSKNGTHRNGKSISEGVLLQDGDIIQVALAQQLVFISSDATLPVDSDEIDFSVLLPVSNSPQAQQGRLRLDKRSRRVWVASQEVLPPLSVSQYRILELLFDNQERVVSRNELAAIVWKDQEAIKVSEQALDALIRRLRERLASIDPEVNYISTVRGHGLRLMNPPV